MKYVHGSSSYLDYFPTGKGLSPKLVSPYHGVMFLGRYLKQWVFSFVEVLEDWSMVPDPSAGRFFDTEEDSMDYSIIQRAKCLCFP